MDSLLRSETTAAFSETTASGAERSADVKNTDTTVYYDGPNTRNDNDNALGGVFPFYAAPQDAVPVFFEPSPTPPMIAARKSFLNRQGWSVQTVTGGKAT